jgi:hypothetical protein
MADLTAEILGTSRQITKSQAVQKMDERTDYLADPLAEGTRSLPAHRTYFSARAGEGPPRHPSRLIASHRSCAHSRSFLWPACRKNRRMGRAYLEAKLQKRGCPRRRAVEILNVIFPSISIAARCRSSKWPATRRDALKENDEVTSSGGK